MTSGEPRECSYCGSYLHTHENCDRTRVVQPEDDWAPCSKTWDLATWASSYESGWEVGPAGNWRAKDHSHVTASNPNGRAIAMKYLFLKYLEAHPKKVTADAVYERFKDGNVDEDGRISRTIMIQNMAAHIADLENEKREAGR